MPRPVRALHHPFQRPEIAPQHRGLRVHLLHGRRKQGGAAGRGQQGGVGFRHARVQAKVLGVGELGGVDEDGGDDVLAVGGGGLHQLQVAGVQGAHGGHQAHPAAGPAGVFGVGAQRGGGRQNLHGEGRPLGRPPKSLLLNFRSKLFNFVHP